MRLSCNGCRVLRKGCSDNCSIRPCLEWIKTSDAQAHATVFLAKFYGRAGLMNLINAGPQHLRPAIFKSLLYEACGRIVNPIYGSVGLIWSGSWQLCENAVAAVLNGAPITRMATEAAETKSGPPLKLYDIRHVNKEENSMSGFGELHRVRARGRFKRVGKGKKIRVSVASVDESVNRSPSHESSLSHQSQAAEANVERGSLASAETTEADHITGAETKMYSGEGGARVAEGEIKLDLTLGLEPFKSTESKLRFSIGSAEDASGVCKMELGLV
ncbi:LOW QUALITY PROTEIN: LOB domain-containing protein 41-like [Primulina tabacum]|uniref:LOW QUALITY PROTEIN: LOB domain-containing protein 41-like n=1 Tax=Primulina tabacum TaxID=48773 RepID=UPI003F5AC129